MSWDTSTRRFRLPSDWKQTRRRILERDPICRACGRNPSREVHHVGDGDDHSDSNLAGLCTPCHAHESALEGAYARPSRQRKPEPHPGLYTEVT